MAKEWAESYISLNTNTNKYSEITNLQRKIHEEKILNLALEEKIHNLLPLITNLRYNEGYGFGYYGSTDNLINNIINNKNYFIAIPYNAINSPLNGSEFTDFELSIFLTSLSYITYFENNNGMRNYDIALLIITIKEYYDKNKIFIDYYLTEIIEYRDIILHLCNCISTVEFINECTKSIVKLNNIKVLKFYLTRCIFPRFFKISSNQYNISMIDMFNKITNIEFFMFTF